MPKTVALLVGGWSSERDVSLMKSTEVEQALKDKGYIVRRIDVTRDLQKLLTDLTPRPDVVFNNLYGQGGEDGVIQGVLEMLQIPYTHSGVMASSIGMDKPTCKRLAESVGVRVPKGGVYAVDEILARDVMPRPYVVKPYNEGSSVGVRIMKDGDNHPAIDRATWGTAPVALVEEYIKGREITVAILDGKPQAVTEIVAAQGFFDYDAKYKDTKTEYILPAKIPADVYKTALDYAERVYRVLGCEGLARCDMRYDDTRGVDGLYLLEINTQPGYTSVSIAPAQVIYNGMSFTDLCAHLVETASCKSAPTTNPIAAAQTAPRAVSA
jgi:D-alanine-D-alanine ligase